MMLGDYEVEILKEYPAKGNLPSNLPSNPSSNLPSSLPSSSNVIMAMGVFQGMSTDSLNIARACHALQVYALWMATPEKALRPLLPTWIPTWIPHAVRP
jgi:hypothetical protein